jgi:protein-tyrosine phosphatase
MAEFVMKDLIQKAGLENQFYIESAATSTEEIGNEVYPPAKRKLSEHNISCRGKTARQMTRGDYQRFDLLIGMDDWNIRNMTRIAGGDPDEKIHKLLDYTNRGGNVADPWYTGDFDATWHDVIEGCNGLLKLLINLSNQPQNLLISSQRQNKLEMGKDPIE